MWSAPASAGTGFPTPITGPGPVIAPIDRRAAPAAGDAPSPGRSTWCSTPILGRRASARASLRSLSMSASGPPSGDVTPVDSGIGAASVASGKTLKPGTAVVGRETELRHLRRLLAETAAGRCTALLVEGEPGVG